MEQLEKRIDFLEGLQYRIEAHMYMIKKMRGLLPELESWYQYKINRYSQLITRYAV